MSGSHYNNQFAWCFPAPTCSFWGGYCGSDCTNNTALYEYDDCDEGQLCCLDGTYFLYTRYLLAPANMCIVLSKFGVEYFWFCTVILIAKIAGSTLSRLHSDTFALALSADLYFLEGWGTVVGVYGHSGGPFIPYEHPTPPILLVCQSQFLCNFYWWFQHKSFRNQYEVKISSILWSICYSKFLSKNCTTNKIHKKERFDSWQYSL